MAIELRGFDDLQNDMVNMAYALDQGPGVNRALRAGAVPIEEQMLHNASTDPKIITDALHSSIHTGKVKQKRGGGKQITIGVHHSENGAYYANPVEFVRPDRALMKVAKEPHRKITRYPTCLTERRKPTREQSTAGKRKVA